jgi:hypothetical protein
MNLKHTDTDTIKIRFTDIEWDIDDGVEYAATIVAPKNYDRDFTVEELLEKGAAFPQNEDGTYLVDDGTILTDDFAEIMSDFLTDEFGWCHEGFLYQLADAEEKANGRSGRRYVMGMKKNTKKPVVIKVGAKPKMKVIDLKEMKNEKIVAKVHAMCRQSFASCIGDAKLAEYEELEDMLRRQ